MPPTHTPTIHPMSIKCFRLHNGAQPGEVGRLVARLQSFGELRCHVVGQWGEGSKDLHHFVPVCAEARVAHLTRATGRQESEHLLGLIVGQYRRLLSVTAVDRLAYFIIYVHICKEHGLTTLNIKYVI